MEQIKKDLLKIKSSYFLSWKTIACKVGIHERTLHRYMYEDYKPGLKGMRQLLEFIDKYKDKHVSTESKK